MPAGPVRVLPELAGRQAERLLEGATERFAMLEAGIEGDISHLVQRRECQPVETRPAKRQIADAAAAGLNSDSGIAPGADRDSSQKRRRHLFDSLNKRQIADEKTLEQDGSSESAPRRWNQRSF